MKPIAIIKSGTTDQTLRLQSGDFEDWIIQRAPNYLERFFILKTDSISRWPNPSSFAAIFITGSHANVTDQADWMLELERYLQQAHEQAVPLLGICFGHQLLAHTFGGKVANNPNGAEFGAVPITLNDKAKTDPLLQQLPKRFFAYMSHRQTVLQLPAKATQLAFSPLDDNAIFYLKPNVWGLQFHPEFDRLIMAHYLQEHFHVSANSLDRTFMMSAMPPHLSRNLLS